MLRLGSLIVVYLTPSQSPVGKPAGTRDKNTTRADQSDGTCMIHVFFFESCNTAAQIDKIYHMSCCVAVRVMDACGGIKFQQTSLMLRDYHGLIYK